MKHTLHSHCGSQQVPRLHIINASIVDKIIGDMLWDPDEVEGESHTKMMQPFVDIADGSEDLEDGEDVDRYRIDIKNPLQFDLAVEYLAAACTFRQIFLVFCCLQRG